MPTPTKKFSDHLEAHEDPDLRLPRSARWIGEESLVDVGWYVEVIRRRLPLIVIVAALAAGIGFGVASLAPLSYEGVTTLLVVLPASPTGPQNTPATFRAIVENATLASQVIDELKLQERLTLQGLLTPRYFVEQVLAVEEVRATNLVKVKVTLPNAELAAAASRRLAEKAIVLTQQVAQQGGTTIQEQLKNHLDKAQERLQSAEKQLLAYKQAAQVDLIKEDTDAQLKARGELLQLVVDIEAERARLAAAKTEIKRQKPVLDAPRVPASEDALRHVQSTQKPEIDTRQLDLTNPYANPVYLTLDFQISFSEARIAALEKQRDELINVKKIGGKDLAQLSELYRRQIEQGRLQASYDLALRVFTDLSLKYEQSRTQAVGGVAQLQVIDAAITPDRPLPRHRMWQALFAGSAGFLGATILVVLVARRRRA